MWRDFGTALCLMMVIEGILPFLTPARWRSLVEKLAEIDDRSMRWCGFISMVLGASLLYLLRH